MNEKTTPFTGNRQGRPESVAWTALTLAILFLLVLQLLTFMQISRVREGMQITRQRLVSEIGSVRDQVRELEERIQETETVPDGE